MVAAHDRYEAVLKSTELKEIELVKAWKRVETIVDQRRTAVKQLSEKVNKLDERARKAHEQGKLHGMRQGKLGEVALAANFIKRLSKEREQLAKLLSAAEEDLKRAVDRYNKAELEVVEARKERRKIETLIARDQQARQIRREAQEESYMDESNQRLKRVRE